MVKNLVLGHTVVGIHFKRRNFVIKNLTRYEYLNCLLWYYLEEGQYENPIDSEKIAEYISDSVMYAVIEDFITEEELNKLNDTWDTGIEWSIKTP